MKLDRNVDPGHRVARHSRVGGNPGSIAMDSRLRGNDTDAPNTEIISGLFLTRCIEPFYLQTHLTFLFPPSVVSKSAFFYNDCDDSENPPRMKLGNQVMSWDEED